MTNGSPPRPRPDADGANRAAEYRAHLGETLSGFADHPGVVGVLLTGGVARGFADDRSEIDVTLYLTAEAAARWRRGEAPVATGITKREDYLYDVKTVDIEAAAAREWSETAQWDASYAEVLYDPEGRVTSLLESKCAPPGPERASELLFSAWWYARLTTDCWRDRGDPIQSHLVLSEAIRPLLRAVFVANGEYVPHEKWLANLSRSLEWTPRDWHERLGEAVRTGPLTAEAVARRQAVVLGLWRDVDREVRSAFDESLPVAATQRSFYEPLARLLEDSRVPLATWESEYGLELLSQDPFHDIATLCEDAVVLEESALADVEPGDLYEWHYEVLEAARGEWADRD